METITLAQGSGGVATQKLISGVFMRAFGGAYLNKMDDAACLELKRGVWATTTDSFVVDPIVFPGGDIGKLAVCGTVNDLASCGAEPKYLTTGFILEEGLPVAVLSKVVASMAAEARRQGVAVVAGDTKVVPRGKLDKIFINTTGLGPVRKRLKANGIRPGDKVLISGNIAEHGLAILLAREEMNFKTRVKSDCNSLWPIVKLLLHQKVSLKFMRDPTRGGVNTALHEIADLRGLSFLLDEKELPVSASCRTLADLLGLELLDVANEGKMLFFVAPQDANRAVRALRRHPLGRRAAVIGTVLGERKARIYLNTTVGGRKRLTPPMTDPIPRIC